MSTFIYNESKWRQLFASRHLQLDTECESSVEAKYGINKNTRTLTTNESSQWMYLTMQWIDMLISWVLIKLCLRRYFCFFVTNLCFYVPVYTTLLCHYHSIPFTNVNSLFLWFILVLWDDGGGLYLPVRFKVHVERYLISFEHGHMSKYPNHCAKRLGPGSQVLKLLIRHVKYMQIFLQGRITCHLSTIWKWTWILVFGR